MEERYQIGSITSGYRVIPPGEEYDKHFPKPQAQDRNIIEDGEVGVKGGGFRTRYWLHK